MSLLVESIRIFNGKVSNIFGHEERANQSRLELFGTTHPLNLHRQINVPPAYSSGVVKCRVLFDTKIRDIQFQHYTIRNISRIKVVEGNDVKYEHKFLERDQLDTLYNQREGCDEIMIVRNEMITDAYYYNFVFCRNNLFFTPKIPILPGVQRQKLLTSGRIQERNIHLADIANFDSIHLINAMTSLGKIVLPIHQIEI